MIRINYEEIKQKFVQKLAERRFLRKEYAIYLYTLSGNENNGDQYKLKLDAFKTTSGFDNSNGVPFSKQIGEIRTVPYEKYQIYRFGRGGEVVSCKSLYNEEPNLLKSKFVEKPVYWEDKFIYFSGYQLENKRLVIFLVFDIDPTSQIESEIRFIYLNSVLRSVEDIYHKDQIFDSDYLGLLTKHITARTFSIARNSIKTIIRDNYTYSRYLVKIYYMFIFENFKMFRDRIYPKQKEKLLKLTQEFETNQKTLFRIPFYRDHFLHQSNVYLLGLALIDILSDEEFNQNLLSIFNKAYRPMAPFDTYIDIALTWFIASLFHDISYPVEKSGQWMDAFFKEYIYPKEYHKHILKIDLNISRMVSDRSYSQCIEDLAEYQRRLNDETDPIGYQRFRNDENIMKACNIRSIIIDQIINFRDHGVLSAIMLLNRFDKDERREIFRYLLPAAAAISIHNFQWLSKDTFKNPCDFCDYEKEECDACPYWKKAYHKYFVGETKTFRYIDFKKNPLGFLLILCDTLQDWGRYDFENLEHAFDGYYNQSRIANIRIEKKKLIFDLKISPSNQTGKKGSKMNFLLYKKQEIAKIFSRLKFIRGYDIIVNLKPVKGKHISFSMNSFN